MGTAAPPPSRDPAPPSRATGESESPPTPSKNMTKGASIKGKQYKRERKVNPLLGVGWAENASSYGAMNSEELKSSTLKRSKRSL